MSDELYKSVMGVVRGQPQPLMLDKWGTEEEAKTYSEGGYKKFWGLGEKK